MTLEGVTYRKSVLGMAREWREVHRTVCDTVSWPIKGQWRALSHSLSCSRRNNGQRGVSTGYPVARAGTLKGDRLRYDETANCL